MKRRSIDKFRFIEHDLPDGGREVIAITSYAGSTIKARAVCAPEDMGSYDFEIGKELAHLRCEKKLTIKQLEKAYENTMKSYKAFKEAEAHYNKALKRQKRAYEAAVNITNQAAAFEGKL